MKKLLTLLTPLMLAGAFSSQAQCNNPFYTLKEGVHYEVESYNSKDKLEAKMLYTITEVAKTNDGYQAVVSNKTLDKKGKEVATGDLRMTCHDGQLEMDIQQLLNNLKQLQETEGTDVDIQGDHLVIPASLSVGDTLPSSTTTMTVKMADNSTMMSTMDFKINKRTVMAKEDVTTSAGTFSCYKITYTMDMSIKVMGMGRTTTYTGAEWIAEEVGMVRNEQYDKNGKLNSYSVLTSYK